MSSIKSLRGMNDILPDRIDTWHAIERALSSVADRYGYREIRTPVAERTELFQRGIGEQTDIVEKEMYTWEDVGGDRISLRPEATASCVRAGIEHGMFHNQTQRLYYVGPMFRRERPQKGRYRQFHQFGIEAFGWTSPDIDAEIMLVANRLWQALDLDDIHLEINSLGSMETRAGYRQTLVDYFRAHVDVLDEDSRRRLESNPLRILDSKNPALEQLIAEAPAILDHLDETERRHFDDVCGYLDDAGVAYRVSPRLVRGIDYYTSTVFEWVTDKLGAQSGVCGGGRYDGLVESLGGRPIPAAGFAIGLERLIELVELAKDGGEGFSEPADVFVATLDTSVHRWAYAISEQLRDHGINVAFGPGESSAKARLRQADRSGAVFAIIVGADEKSDQTVTLKPLRSSGEQERIAVSKLPVYLAERLQSENNPE